MEYEPPYTYTLQELVGPFSAQRDKAPYNNENLTFSNIAGDIVRGVEQLGLDKGAQQFLDRCGPDGRIKITATIIGQDGRNGFGMKDYNPLMDEKFQRKLFEMAVEQEIKYRTDQLERQKAEGTPNWNGLPAMEENLQKIKELQTKITATASPAQDVSLQ